MPEQGEPERTIVRTVDGTSGAGQAAPDDNGDEMHLLSKVYRAVRGVYSRRGMQRVEERRRWREERASSERQKEELRL